MVLLIDLVSLAENIDDKSKEMLGFQQQLFLSYSTLILFLTLNSVHEQWVRRKITISYIRSFINKNKFKQEPEEINYIEHTICKENLM